MRFQAMVIFLTAVALIIDHGTKQRPGLGVATLLIALAVGMLILDLRNRALVWESRCERKKIRRDLETNTGKTKSKPSPDLERTPGRTRKWKWEWKLWKWEWKWKLVSHTTVFDSSYGGVLGYAVSLYCHNSNWPIVGVFAFVGGAVVIGVAHLSYNCIKGRFASRSW
jgi:hypothetical protein